MGVTVTTHPQAQNAGGGGPHAERGGVGGDGCGDRQGGVRDPRARGSHRRGVRDRAGAHTQGEGGGAEAGTGGRHGHRRHPSRQREGNHLRLIAASFSRLVLPGLRHPVLAGHGRPAAHGRTHQRQLRAALAGAPREHRTGGRRGPRRRAGQAGRPSRPRAEGRR